MIRRVWINPPSYHVDGDLRLVITSETELETVGRRVSRTATLDGSAVVYDTGHSSGDRIFLLFFPGITQADSETLQAWVKAYSTLYIATDESVFEAVPEEYKYARGRGQLRALVTSDLVND